MAEAWEGYTLGPAYAADMENRLGRLAPNYLADLIVLEKDPFTCDPDELLTHEVIGYNGRWRMGRGTHHNGDCLMAEQQRLTPEMLVPRMGEYLIQKGLITPERPAESA